MLNLPLFLRQNPFRKHTEAEIRMIFRSEMKEYLEVNTNSVENLMTSINKSIDIIIQKLDAPLLEHPHFSVTPTYAPLKGEQPR